MLGWGQMAERAVIKAAMQRNVNRAGSDLITVAGGGGEGPREKARVSATSSEIPCHQAGQSHIHRHTVDLNALPATHRCPGRETSFSPAIRNA